MKWFDQMFVLFPSRYINTKTIDRSKLEFLGTRFQLLDTHVFSLDSNRSKRAFALFLFLFCFLCRSISLSLSLALSLRHTSGMLSYSIFSLMSHSLLISAQYWPHHQAQTKTLAGVHQPNECVWTPRRRLLYPILLHRSTNLPRFHSLSIRLIQRSASSCPPLTILPWFLSLISSIPTTTSTAWNNNHRRRRMGQLLLVWIGQHRPRPFFHPRMFLSWRTVKKKC